MFIKLKNKLYAATFFSPELYDLLGFHTRKPTWLGRVANLSLKAGFKILSFLRKKNPIKQSPDKMSPGTVDVDSFPWLKPLTSISSNKGERVLIIAEIHLPQCYKYRVKQKVEMFEYLGYEVTVCNWNDIFQAKLDLQSHGLVIFYRVPAFAGVRSLLEECERLGLETFFDIDDLIFDMEEYSKNTNIISLPAMEKEELLRGVELYRYTLKNCRHAIASTPVVANFMKKYCSGQIYIVENCLDKQMFNLEGEISKSSLVKNQNYVIIGYGSGTTTHDADFRQCTSALIKILTLYPQVRLAIHGYLQLPAEFKPFGSQILRVPFLLADDYFRALATFDINLAPLEKTLFNDAKSNIKFIEASIFSIPTIASPGAAFKQVINSGENGFLCSSPDEWFKSLSVLIEDKNKRIEVGIRAKETALNFYAYQKVAQNQLLPMVKKHLSPAKRKKRILVVNILFTPIAFGGATIVTEELARLVNQKEEMEVTIFTGFWDDGGTDIPAEGIVRYEALGIPVIAVRFPGIMTQKLEYYNTNIARRFKEILQSVKPDIVHFHSIQQLGATLAESCFEQNIPYIVTLHDTWWLCERQFMVREDGVYCNQFPIEPRVCVNDCTADSAHTYSRYYYLRNILKNASMLLAPSQFQKNLYVANGFNESHVKVNKNGVLPPGPGFNKIKNSKVHFAYLGGNAVHKGYDWLKKIFESINLSSYTLHLTDCQRKIGTPSIKASNWQISGELIISGGFNQETIDEFFSSIDVLLFPSQCKESFGLTVREALIRDVWVITTDSGGPVEDVVPGVNGQIFTQNDADGFKQAVIDIINKPKNFINPHKDQICLFSEQAEQLHGLYDSLL